MASNRKQPRLTARRRSRHKLMEHKKDWAGLTYTRWNGRVLVAGIAVILIGYFCLSWPPVDGFLSLTLAPILLVVGYCILIPIALLVKDSSLNDTPSFKTTENSSGG